MPSCRPIPNMRNQTKTGEKNQDGLSSLLTFFGRPSLMFSLPTVISPTIVRAMSRTRRLESRFYFSLQRKFDTRKKRRNIFQIHTGRWSNWAEILLLPSAQVDTATLASYCVWCVDEPFSLTKMSFISFFFLAHSVHSPTTNWQHGITYLWSLVEHYESDDDDCLEIKMFWESGTCLIISWLAAAWVMVRVTRSTCWNGSIHREP